jgi:type I restriction enzyme, R subunit
MTKSDERTFQNEIIDSMLVNGWLLGEPNKYNRVTALYEEDLLGFVQESQPKEWAKYERLYPKEAETRLINAVVKRLEKSNPNTSDKELRRFGTLGVLRKEINDTPCRFSLCQFKPEHNLNPETLKRYNQNRLRVVPELVYSPYATEEHLRKTSTKAKAYRIDLVLFINGLPIITLELKSEFKQAIENAVKQYKTTRLPKDTITRKTEPLLTFKRGALVHFAVSQYEVFMCTKLSGTESFFLPFNKGSKGGGKGNDVPENPNRYATDYLWNEVLLPDNILRIISDFVHLEIKEKQDATGLKHKKETLIFPRYHQWDVVKKLIAATRLEGAGHRYLIQHSAGSGKSNSIAWTAHQLSALYDNDGNKQFDSIIIVTDRTILDAQLQDTISQFTDIDGVVGRINHKEGQGSKSEKLAKALESRQRIIIVTIQTFAFVLDWIEKSAKLKKNRFAVIADEAHSSQSGSTAKGMKGILSKKREDEDTKGL